MAAEAAVPGAGHHLAELLAADPDQSPVVAALEADLVEPRQAVVEHHVQAVRFAERRDRAQIAVREQLADLLLGGERDVIGRGIPEPGRD